MRTERQEVKHSYNKYCSSKGSEYDYFASINEDLQSKTKKIHLRGINKVITLKERGPYHAFLYFFISNYCAKL